MIGIALMSWLAACAHASTLVDIQSPALQQLKDVEATAPDQQANPEKAKDGGSLGFTIQTLKPIGYRTADGGATKPDPVTVPHAPDEQPLPPARTPDPAADAARKDQPAAGGSKCYSFSGNSAMKGVTIYTPHEDPTCKETTQEPPPKEGPISKKMIYGALGLGAAAVAAGFLLWPPALLIGGLLLGAGAVLWYVNKKLS